ncbi:MAG: hypothetical protein RL670_1164 [Actinomycetota bacterium]
MGEALNDRDRIVMGIPALLFAIFQAILGVLSLPHYTDQLLPVVAIGLYLAIAMSNVFLHEALELPKVQALANLLVTASLPPLVNSSLDGFDMHTHSTWYIEGVAIILGITAIRQHPWIAGFGLMVLWVEVLAWSGPDTIFSSGLIGASLLVFAAAAAAEGLKGLRAEGERVLEQQKITVKQTTALQVASTTRAQLLERNLQGAVSWLERIARTENFNSKDRAALARLGESLHDGLAGGALATAEVREAISRARDCGVRVTVNIGHDLDLVVKVRLRTLRARLIEELDAVSSGHVIIRSLKVGDFKVQFTVTESGNPKPTYEVKF